MKERNKKYKNFFTRIHRNTWYYLVGIVVLCAVIGVLYFVSNKNTYVTVRLRVSDPDALYSEGSVVPELGLLYKPGLRGKDMFGRTLVEIQDVTSYYRYSYNSNYLQKNIVYLTLRVYVSYSNKTDTYKYKGYNLGLGEWVKFEVGSLTLAGYVIGIGDTKVLPTETISVTARLKTEDVREGSMFGGSTGVDTYIADAIHVGDTEKDMQGNVIAEVTEKTVTPAETVTSDLYGNILDRPNPRKVDVYLRIKLHVVSYPDGTKYYKDTPIKVNSLVSIFLPNIIIQPRITSLWSK